MSKKSKSKNSLIDGQRVRRYLLYAVGEILLVVVGILIAVQINNLNEAHKKSKNEIFLLQELADNLRQDGLQVQAILGQREKTQRAILRMNGYLDAPGSINRDSLAYDLAQLFTFERYFPIRTSYEVAKVSGLQLSNKTLRSSIADYYEYEQNILQTSLKDIEHAFLTQFPDIPSEHYSITTYGKDVELYDYTDADFLAAIRRILSYFIPNHSGTLTKLRDFNATNTKMIENILRELKQHK